MSALMTRSLRPNDLFALRYVHDARLSPDSSQVAWVMSRTDEEVGREIFEIKVTELGTASQRELQFPGSATHPRWSPGGDCLAFVGLESDIPRLHIADAALRNSRAISPEGLMIQGPPSWSPDGSMLAYTVAKRLPHPDLRRITTRIFRSEGIGMTDDLQVMIHIADLRAGSTRTLNLACNVATQPSFSPCGRYLLFLGAHSAVGFGTFGGLKLFTLDLATGRTTQVLGNEWLAATAAWSPCGNRIVFAGDRNSSLTIPIAGLWSVRRDGTDSQCRTSGLIGNVGLRVHYDMPTWSTSQANSFVVPDPSCAYATIQRGGSAEIWRIALQGPTDCNPVVTGPRSCLVLDACSRACRLVYCTSDLHQPWELFVADADGSAEKRLTLLNRSVLADWPILSLEHLRFQSSDGLALEGWHVKRSDLSGPQPTVMFIHGGPFLGIGHAFRYDFHLLASNGYAVLFANFRGSAAYGQEFSAAIMGDWGARGFPDHMAAADAAVAMRLADPKRLGVWGPSHGGFATCWMVGHTTRFRAAVAESAICNFSTLYYLTDDPDVFARDLGGRPDEIPDVYRSRSPLTYAHRCQTPTLLLHGADDLRCPRSEAEQFYRALHDAGCTTELVIIPGMNHMGDSTGPLSARRGQNEALLDWFRRYL